MKMIIKNRKWECGLLNYNLGNIDFTSLLYFINFRSFHQLETIEWFVFKLQSIFGWFVFDHLLYLYRFRVSIHLRFWRYIEIRRKYARATCFALLWIVIIVLFNRVLCSNFPLIVCFLLLCLCILLGYPYQKLSDEITYRQLVLLSLWFAWFMYMKVAVNGLLN